MSSSDYYEQLWLTVPEGSTPPGLELRRAFLLDGLRAAASRSQDPSRGPHGEQPLRVLDVGCGEAQLTAAVARAGCVVVGVDVAEEPLRRARELHAGLDLRRIPADREWPLQDASFDLVWAGETIEHVTD